MPVREQVFNADGITPDNWPGIVRCRKKPVTIHAVQLNLPGGFTVTTLEGTIRGGPGDWLMFGVEGEKYICRGDIFKKTYEIIDEDPGGS